MSVSRCEVFGEEDKKCPARLNSEGRDGVESIARVDSLSLSGKLLVRAADRFLVQWPQLAKKYTKAEYIGRVC